MLRQLLDRQGWAPRVMVTDTLTSYAAAKRDVMPGVGHRQHNGINNWAAPAQAFTTWAKVAGTPLTAA